MKVDIYPIFRMAMYKIWWVRERSGIVKKRDNQRLTSPWIDHTLSVLGPTYEWLSRQKHLKDGINLLKRGKNNMNSMGNLFHMLENIRVYMAD